MQKNVLQVKISEVDQGTKWQRFQWMVYVAADNASDTEGDRERDAVLLRTVNGYTIEQEIE